MFLCVCDFKCPLQRSVQHPNSGSWWTYALCICSLSWWTYGQTQLELLSCSNSNDPPSDAAPSVKLRRLEEWPFFDHLGRSPSAPTLPSPVSSWNTCNPDLRLFEGAIPEDPQISSSSWCSCDAERWLAPWFPSSWLLPAALLPSQDNWLGGATLHHSQVRCQIVMNFNRN